MSARSPRTGNVGAIKAQLREGAAAYRQSTAQPRQAGDDAEFEEMLSKASFLNIRQKKKLAALRSGRAGSVTSEDPPLHPNGASVGVVRVAPPGSDRDEWRCRVLACPNKNYHRLKDAAHFSR